MQKRMSTRVGVVIAIIAASAYLSAAPGTPVADAAERGDKEGVRALVKQAVDVNAARATG